MERKIMATEEQLAYARLLDQGMKVGLLMLVITFLIYLSGVLTPHVAVNDLPNYWKLSVNKYLEATGINAGWAWPRPRRSLKRMAGRSRFTASLAKGQPSR